LSIYPDPQPQDEHNSLGATIRNRYFESLEGKPASSAAFLVCQLCRAQARSRRDGTRQPPEPEAEALSVEVAIPVEEVRAPSMRRSTSCRRAASLRRAIRRPLTAPSKHFMSPAYERATAFIEVPMLKTKAELDGVKIDADQMLDRIAKPELTKVEHELCYSGQSRGGPTSASTTR